MEIKVFKLIGNFLKQLKKYIIIILALIIVLSVPFWFIMSSSTIEPAFAKILKIRVDPAISGGSIIAKFYDDSMDDYGDGSYQYPLHESFNDNNICDIISYEVYRPILDNGLTNPLALWQIAVSFSNLINPLNNEGGFSNIQLAIYIDIDGAEDGSNKTYFENAEYVEFPEYNAWDIAIFANGTKLDKALIFYSYDISKKFDLKGYKDKDLKKGKEIRAIFVKEQNKIYFQIPLDNKFIQKILDGRKTYHWVFAGFYDTYGNGGWLNIKEEATIRYGGGLKWENGPRIFDMLTPSGFDQKQLLSKENANSDGFVIIPPLIVNGFNPGISYLKEDKPGKLDETKNKDIAKINELTKKIEEEEKQSKLDFEKEIEDKLKSTKPTERLYALFSTQKFDVAKILVNEILKKDAENPVALAYKGSLTAMEGGKAKNPMQAIVFVNKAYEYLDKACNIMENFENNIANSSFDITKYFESNQQFYEYYIIVLSNRAIVSSSVPDDVFKKLNTAISDFQKIAKIYEKIGKIKESSLSLMQAAILFEKKGKKDEANVIWLSLSKLVVLPAKVELELLKRNFK